MTLQIAMSFLQNKKPLIGAILIPAAFFLVIASPTAKEPNWLMNLAHVGVASISLLLGVMFD